MPKRRKEPPKAPTPRVHGVIEGAGSVIEQPIVDTLEKNYMPYAMSVILSRAIPEIDGFKPSHRKLLYTMYQMGLLGPTRTKSANIVGQTMRLNPHGDAAIYDTMVRLSRGILMWTARAISENFIAAIWRGLPRVIPRPSSIRCAMRFSMISIRIPWTSSTTTTAP